LIIVSGCSRDNKLENKSQELNLVPSPKKTLNRGGENTYSGNFWIIADVSNSGMSDLASYLASGLKGITNEETLITDLYSSRKHNQSIKLELNTSLENKKAYVLDLTSPQVKIEAGSAQGIFYGIQTFLQILNIAKSDSSNFIIPRTIIKDSPSHNIRGALVTPAQIANDEFEKLISKMRRLKLNYLLIDNSMLSYPKLNQMAAKYFIKVSSINDLASDTSVYNFGDSDEEIEEFYSSFLPSSNSAEMVLDLRSTERLSYNKKLIVISEISWTNSNYRSLDDLKSKTKDIE
jgi:hypothetical protein